MFQGQGSCIPPGSELPDSAVAAVALPGALGPGPPPAQGRLTLSRAGSPTPTPSPAFASLALPLPFLSPLLLQPVVGKLSA